MRVFYQFHGGELNKRTMVRSEVEEIACGHSLDNSSRRARGILCSREELDNQPKVKGYIGPMWDGERYILTNGEMVYKFEQVDPAAIVEVVGIIRYETQEVYNMLSR